MDTATRPSGSNTDSPYLHCLQALTGEIEAAMVAIASDDLPSFTEGVARQEALASNLQSLRRALQKTSALTQPASAVVAAERELRLANLQYAALLKHFSRTITMLLAVCNSHTGEILGHSSGQTTGQIQDQMKEARGTRSKHQTWSCEM